jgi:hypothetical protein
MTWTTQVLVVARQTLASEPLLEALCARAAQAGPGLTEFTLLVPGGRSASAGDVRGAMGAMRDRGLNVRVLMGERDPIVAVREAWGPGLYDEIIVSTLPLDSSRWLRIDLPSRIQRITGAIVTHVADTGGVPQARLAGGGRAHLAATPTH